MVPPNNEVLQALNTVSTALESPTANVDAAAIQTLQNNMPQLIQHSESDLDTQQKLQRMQVQLRTRISLSAASMATATAMAGLSNLGDFGSLVSNSLLAPAADTQQLESLRRLQTSLNAVRPGPASMVEAPIGEANSTLPTAPGNAEVLQNPEAQPRKLNNWVVLGLTAVGAIALWKMVVSKSRGVGSFIKNTLIAGAVAVGGLWLVNKARAGGWFSSARNRLGAYLLNNPQTPPSEQDQAQSKKTAQEVVKKTEGAGRVDINNPELLNANPDAAPNLLQVATIRTIALPGGRELRLERRDAPAPGQYLFVIGGSRYTAELTVPDTAPVFGGTRFNLGMLASRAHRVNIGNPSRQCVRLHADLSRHQGTRDEDTTLRGLGANVPPIFVETQALANVIGAANPAQASTTTMVMYSEQQFFDTNAPTDIIDGTKRYTQRTFPVILTPAT